MLGRYFILKNHTLINQCRPLCTSLATATNVAETVQLSESSVKEVDGPIMDKFGRVYATGRRKTSVARVWLKEGSGQFIVNDKSLIEYFQPLQREHTLQPFCVTKTAGQYDVWCTVKGGGMSGQAGAIRLGISRALVLFQPPLKTELKQYSMMTRDSRKVERKKPGQKKARKKYQRVKR